MGGRWSAGKEKLFPKVRWRREGGRVLLNCPKEKKIKKQTQRKKKEKKRKEKL